MEAIGQLTGGIAHDFNNILTSVIGYVVLGQERAEALGDATLVRQLGQAHLAAQRARDLIAQMLAFARRQRGERRVLALAPLVRQSVQLLRATLPSSIVLDTLGARRGPDEATPPVDADAVQLEQVLFNLCINARDAIAGNGHIRVGLRAIGGGWRCSSCGARVDGGHWVELSVADDGAGIAPEVIERMFEPFFSTKEVGRGSGMGLAMVHGIVHDHGGHVRVDTKLGRGTTFRVMLPAAQAEDGTGRERTAGNCGSRRAARPRAAGRGRADGRRLHGRAAGRMGTRRGAAARPARRGRVARRPCERARPPDHRPDDAADDRPRAGGTRAPRATRPAGAAVHGQRRRLRSGEIARRGVRAVLRKPIDAEALRAACAAREALRGPLTRRFASAPPGAAGAKGGTAGLPRALRSPS